MSYDKKHRDRDADKESSFMLLEVVSTVIKAALPPLGATTEAWMLRAPHVPLLSFTVKNDVWTPPV